MSAPARAGIFIYAKDPDRLSDFYKSVLGMAAAHRTDQMVVLRSPDLQLIVHVMPPEVASQVTITSPPQLRDNAAIKFFCTVPSLSGAEESAQALGGQVLPEQWKGPGFVVRNACDPEGNIFQASQLMSFEAVRKLESILGATLPADYRVFLTTHTTEYLEPPLLVRHVAQVPGSGPEDVVTSLYTAASLLESELLGEPEEKMVIIGQVEPGGYLYMCFKASDFGSVYVRFPYQDSTFYPVGKSFSVFMARCRPDTE